MNQVITINLNGNAYQVEQQGYDAITQYVKNAEMTLADDPDKTEIMNDLEQAIAEKCARFVFGTKNVVTNQEIEQIITEMGPVHAVHEDSTADASTDATQSQTNTQGSVKKFYLIHEGKMIAGVCTGIAVYFNIDVTLVRIACVTLAIITNGVSILLYLLMMLFIPYAQTSEQKAAAQGAPFNAQELIERAKKKYAQFTADHKEHQKSKYEWHYRTHEMKEAIKKEAYANAIEQVNMKHAQWSHYPRRHSSPVTVAFLSTIFTLIAVLTIYSWATTGEFFWWSVAGNISGASDIPEAAENARNYIIDLFK